jgi:putative hydrolase of HD superfamily
MTWLNTLDPRLGAQLRFLIEADRLKNVVRANRIADASRRENTAEHSWHLALFAVVLAEYATGPVDIGRVIEMLLIHDLVEIECGDTPLFDTVNVALQAEREAAAALVVFGHLPDDQGKRLHGLWIEFEAARSVDARFAKALDRFQPILLNHLAQGGTWIDYAVGLDRERAATRRIDDGAPALWQAAQSVFAEAVTMGWLKAGAD